MQEVEKRQKGRCRPVHTGYNKRGQRWPVPCGYCFFHHNPLQEAAQCTSRVAAAM